MNDGPNRPGLVIHPVMRDLSDEEDAAAAQRRITEFHLWLLSLPAVSDDATTDEPRPEEGYG